jgi:hypothetical protein
MNSAMIVVNLATSKNLIVKSTTLLHRAHLKGMKTDRGKNCIMMNFTACILHRILLG